MKIKYINKLLIVLLAIVGLSCSDYLDINTDPNNPTVGRADLLLTNSEVAIAGAVGFSTGGLSSELGVFMHQITRRGEGDQYGTQGNDFMINSAWQQFYDIALQDLNVMIVSETKSGNLIYAGIAKILKAYSYSIIVDVWGDVPFAEAHNIDEFRFPKFDDDASIYPQLLDLIDEGVADMKNTEGINALKPAKDDVIYGGSIVKWERFANTLKLRMLNQARMVSTIPDADAQITALMTENNFIKSKAEDFELWYGTSNSPENRHPTFANDYATSSPEFYFSIWFYEILNGLNPDILTGVVDPRIPYYYYRQLKPGEAAENPTEYLTAEGFLSIHFGSIHPNSASGQQSSQTVVGMYPCGGFYDDGSAITVTSKTGDGAAPERMLNYFKLLYIQAELALDGVITGDPKALLTSAIQASFDEVNEIAGVTTQTAVPKILKADIDAYIASVMVEYDAGSTDRRLEIILTQKWIASFGNSVDAYNDYRRRGYPVIFNPLTDVGPYATTTTSGSTFLLSLPWRSDDLNLNPEAPAQKNPRTDGVFWDPNL